MAVVKSGLLSCISPLHSLASLDAALPKNCSYMHSMHQFNDDALRSRLSAAALCMLIMLQPLSLGQQSGLFRPCKCMHAKAPLHAAIRMYLQHTLKSLDSDLMS